MLKRISHVSLAGIAGIVLASTASRAQLPGLDLGATAGVNLATFWGSNVGHGSDTHAVRNLTAVMVGLSVIHQLTPMLAFQPEILYSRKGTSIDDLGDKSELKLSYIEVPLLLKIRLSSKIVSASPALYAGPYVAYNIGCNYHVTSNSVRGGPLPLGDHDCGTDIKSLDWGLTGGAGLDFGNFGVFARYSLGLTSTNSSFSGQDEKNRVITVGGRWSFSPMH